MSDSEFDFAPHIDKVEAFINREARVAPDEYVDCVRVDIESGAVSADIVNEKDDGFTRWSGGGKVVERLVSEIPDWWDSPIVVRP